MEATIFPVDHVGNEEATRSETHEESDPSPQWRHRLCSTLLLRAVERANDDTVSALLDRGARFVVNARDEMGLTPLHRASLKGNGRASVVRTLTRAGADLESTFEGLTPLHMASGRGNDEVVLALLQEGADRDARTSEGFTALHCAAGKGGLACVRVLLKAGADPNIKSSGQEKRTPLHAAAVLGDSHITEELLKHGAAVDTSDSEGVTVLHIAAAKDHEEVAWSLLAWGASVHSVHSGNLETALHVAASEGSCRVLKALLEAGADVSARSVTGNTPLHCACTSLEHRAVEVLLQWNANEAAMNVENECPSQVMGQDLGQATGGNSTSAVSGKILSLLAKAPADRRWRRRGWMVALRARLQNRSGTTFEQPTRALQASDGSPRKAKMEWGQRKAYHFLAEMRGMEVESEPQARSNSDGNTWDSYSHLVWTSTLEEEGIFRHIVAFL